MISEKILLDDDVVVIEVSHDEIDAKFEKKVKKKLIKVLFLTPKITNFHNFFTKIRIF